jgi:hypothetical protein
MKGEMEEGVGVVFRNSPTSPSTPSFIRRGNFVNYQNAEFYTP